MPHMFTPSTTQVAWNGHDHVADAYDEPNVCAFVGASHHGRLSSATAAAAQLVESALDLLSGPVDPLALSGGQGFLGDTCQLLEVARAHGADQEGRHLA